MCSSILLVDDDEAYRDAMGICLSAFLGDVVQHTAQDAATALELSKHQLFDLAILDFNMPGINGVELFKHIRQVQPKIEGILVSGELSASRISAALEAGMLAAIHKLSDCSKLLTLTVATCQQPLKQATAMNCIPA